FRQLLALRASARQFGVKSQSNHEEAEKLQRSHGYPPARSNAKADQENHHSRNDCRWKQLSAAAQPLEGRGKSDDEASQVQAERDHPQQRDWRKISGELGGESVEKTGGNKR